jgi:hypothetical protein
MYMSVGIYVVEQVRLGWVTSENNTCKYFYLYTFCRGEFNFDQCVCVPYKLLDNVYATVSGCLNFSTWFIKM